VVDGVLRIDLPRNLDGTLDGVSAAPLAPDMTTFVAGPENRLSILALEKLLTGGANFSAAAWASPLVLIGPTGSGKSLLARAIVRRWLPILGADRVVYFTAIDFARQLLAAREDKQLPELRRRLANVQLFVLEDLHKLPAKAALHHELRDLIDKLTEAGATVLCTSQVAPKSQPHLDAGLSDRLVGGLLLWLNHPGVEARLELLRLELLRLSADERHTNVDDRQLRALAENSAGPVSHLLRALRELEVAPIVGTHPGTLRTVLSAKEIITVVARYFRVTQAALRGPQRRKSLVFARSVAVYLLRSMTDASYAQIGKELGKRDHSTIMHSMASMQLALASDAATQQAVEELRRILVAA
jgi:chromosomal replication initiator protein